MSKFSINDFLARAPEAVSRKKKPEAQPSKIKNPRVVTKAVNTRSKPYQPRPRKKTTDKPKAPFDIVTRTMGGWINPSTNDFIYCDWLKSIIETPAGDPEKLKVLLSLSYSQDLQKQIEATFLKRLRNI
jgi:hypothetical protein